jgi:PAS domain S-box-containing protein
VFPEKLQDDIDNSRHVEDTVLVTAIQQGEESLSMLADTAPVMIWMAGCDTLYNYFNSAWLQFTGRSHLQEVDNGWMEGVHSEDRQQCQDIYLTSFEIRQKFHRQYRLRRADGEYRWILDTAAPRFAADGGFAGYIGYVVDITEVKVKKISFIESESRLRLALDAAEMGVWDWNFRTGKISCSEQVEHLFGWRSNSLPTNYKAFLKCIHRSDRSIVTGAIRNTLEERTNYDADFRIVLQDSTVRWVRGKGDVLRDRNGQAVRMMGTLIDITERKLAELALEETKQQLENRVEERTTELKSAIASLSDVNVQLQTEITQRQQAEAELRALFAAMSDVILVLDAQGHYLKIAPTNPISLYKPPEDLIGKTLHDVFGRSQADFFLDKIQRAITNQETINFEYCLSVDNAEVWFAASVSPLSQDTVIWVARDITAHRQAEQERDRFFQIPLEMLCIAGFDGYFKQLNPAWEETLGWTQEELKAFPFIEFVHPDDREATIAAAQKLATGNDVISFENRYRCKDGSYKWLLWTSRTVPQQQLIYAVARDVSDRKLAEQALRQNEAQYRRLIETAAEGIWILDLEGKTSFANPKIAQMLGYTVEEMIGMPLFAFMDAEGQAIAAENLERRRQGVAEQHDFKFCRKDGSELWAMIATNPIFDDAGQYLGTLGMLTDISDRKRAEEALQKSEARNRAMLDAIPDLMFRSNREGVYLDYMAAKDAELAVPAHEIIGKSVCELLPPDLAQQAISYTEQALNQGSIQIFEYQLPTKGELRDYEARVVPSGEDEVLAIVRDITERKQTEEALQALVAGTAAVTGEEFFPALVRHLAAALGVRYALVAEKVGTEYTKARVLAFWAGDRLRENFEYDLANTPCENVAKQGMAYYLFGVQQLFPLDGDLAAMQAQSYLGASFIDSFGVAIGHIAVFDTKPMLEEERAKAILSIFAARATAELQRQRTEDALRQSERQFRELASKEALLNRLASQIRASLDISTIMEIAVTEIRNLLQIDLCSFTWYRTDVQPPHWEVFQEAKNIAIPSLLDFRPTSEEIGLIAQKVFNKEIIRVDDVEAVADPISRQFFVSLGLTATLILPIHTQSGEIGALSCSYFTGSRVWLDSEVELLLAVTDQIAIAIDQAELYKQSRIAAQTAQEKAQQLEETLQELQATQAQLIQNEKMSSLGQLVAGVAHEINNPVNFIHGNITHASEYAQDLLHLVELYQQHYPNPVPEIEEEIEAIDLEFLCQDLPKLLTSMRIGTDRIRQIVLSLRNFSRLDEADMKAVDIHEGIDNTLLLLQNRLKAKPEHQEIQIIKEYSDLPLVDCYAGQLNQVFMNLLANAIDALEESFVNRHLSLVHDSQQMTNDIDAPSSASRRVGQMTTPQIHIRTEIQDNFVFIRIADNGSGMTEEVRQKLFDPFFTTKPVGKGTGMGLSISYKIIVEKHMGKLQCISAPGKGAEFVVAIPLKQLEY